MEEAAQGRTDPQSPKGNNLHGDLVPATAVLAQGNSLLTTNLVALHHFFPPGCNDSNSHPHLSCSSGRWCISLTFLLHTKLREGNARAQLVPLFGYRCHCISWPGKSQMRVYLESIPLASLQVVAGVRPRCHPGALNVLFHPCS